MRLSKHSCLYTGTVRHRRFAPTRNEFRYRLFMPYLDLDELPTLFRGRLLWSYDRPNVAAFRREDYLGDPQVPLADAVRETVLERVGFVPSGPIRMLGHLRYLGYCFNPVTFYYCFDAADTRLEAVVAEVTNTPWGERHAYVLGPFDDARQAKRQTLDKALHVSPFFSMQQRYRWSFSEPGDGLVVHMENHEGTERPFDATLVMRRRALDGRALATVLLRHPAMTATVQAAIHFQALRLWLKGTPFFPHPTKSPRSKTAKGALTS